MNSANARNKKPLSPQRKVVLDKAVKKIIKEHKKTLQMLSKT